jgi:hypothetical protein
MHICISNCLRMNKSAVAPAGVLRLFLSYYLRSKIKLPFPLLVIGIQRITRVTLFYNIYPFINIYIWTGVKIPSWQLHLEPPKRPTNTVYCPIRFTFAPWIDNGPGIWTN